MNRRHLLIPSLLTIGCMVPSGWTTNPPPGSSGGDGAPLVIESFDDSRYHAAPTGPVLVTDGAGDPNQRPIHVWFIGAPSQRDRAYTVGHADEKCCTLVSGALFDAATHVSLREHTWISYGVGDINSEGDLAAQRRLTELERQLREYAASPVCRGQLVIHGLAYDEIAQASDDVVTMAKNASRVAMEERRPIMVWYELPPDLPVFVPALGTRPGEQDPSVVDFTIGKAEMGFPQDVLNSVSLDGVGQYIAYLRVSISSLQESLRFRKMIDGIEGKALSYGQIRKLGYSMNYRDPGIGSRIRAAIAQMERVSGLWKSHGTKLAELLSVSGRAELKEFRNDLARFLSQNREALRQWEALPPTAGPLKQKIFFIEPEQPVYLPRDIVARLPSKAELKAELSAARRELKQAKALQASPPPDAMPSLIDASTRGWSATFSSLQAEQSYDRWAQRRQGSVHEIIGQRISEQGYGFGFSDLLSYRVLFRADKEQSNDYRVTPTYLLNEGFYIVADPSTGLVRYESPNTDENLPVIDG
ncbi:MAG: hypothetical protein AAGF11_21000 [Myxococcota bacterium]